MSSKDYNSDYASSLEVWGERQMLIFKAAQEIDEMGEPCVDTYMQCVKQEIRPEEVARALHRIHELQEENED